MTDLLSRLAPYPGRLEFALRLAALCALTAVVVELYQTPDPALAIYIAFFALKRDRMESIVTSVVLTVLITIIIGLLLLTAAQVMDDPMWRVAAMATFSFCFLFAASASKLKEIGNIVALITVYALDLIGTVQIGELAVRALLYAWLLVAIPAGLCIVVNLLAGPAPRRLAMSSLAGSLRAAARIFIEPGPQSVVAFASSQRAGGQDAMPGWLKLAKMERTSTAGELAALEQAQRSTVAVLHLTEVAARKPDAVPRGMGRAIGASLLRLAASLDRGDVLAASGSEVAAQSDPVPSRSAALIARIKTALEQFATPRPQAGQPKGQTEHKEGFFVPDAFTNPAHVQFALKGTAAAVFCYLAYSLLDWRGIHTCLITCYVCALGTTAETIEKLTLRIVGCLIGAGAGLAAIVFLLPSITSIAALAAVVFAGALAGAWVAAGGPRIAYMGFQLAFAFFLCVVQGNGPGFDLTVARDRVIGILLGNLVTAFVFTQFWPVSVAKRLDSALLDYFAQLRAMAAAASRDELAALAGKASLSRGAVAQELTLLRYEPAFVRPDKAWIESRTRLVDAIEALQAPLFLAVDCSSLAMHKVEQRLARLGSALAAQLKSGAIAGEIGANQETLAAKHLAHARMGLPMEMLMAALDRLEEVLSAKVDEEPFAGEIHVPA